MIRFRVRFDKHGKIRFTSHRDMARIWERAIRKVGLPVAYTEGFTPRPRISFGLALPTGYASDGEYLDIVMDESAVGADGAVSGTGVASETSIDLIQMKEQLSRALPVGMNVQAIEMIAGRTGSLQEEVVICTWRFEIRELGDIEARGAVADVLAADRLMVTRQRKGRETTEDIRPAVLSLAVKGEGETGVELEAELAAKPRLVRPSELMAFLAPDHELGPVTRTHQWIEQGGAPREPIPGPATPAPRAQRRAS